MDTTLLRIETLGTFRLLRLMAGSDGYEEIAINVSRTGPPLTFLKVLLAIEPQLNNQKNSQHQASKDIVIDALWPEEDHIPTDMQNALAHAKSAVNRAFRPFLGGQDLILRTEGSDKTGYRLNLALVTIDADEFDQWCTQASEAEGRGDEVEALQRWESAWALVQGDFLPQDQYNEWSQTRREKLASRYRLCLHRLAFLLCKSSRTIEAIEILHTYAHIHPLCVDILLVLIPLLSHQQRYEEILRLITACKEAHKCEGREVGKELIDIESRICQSQKAAFRDLAESLFPDSPHQRAQALNSSHLPHMLQLPQVNQATVSPMFDVSHTFLGSILVGHDLWFGGKLGYLLTLIEDCYGQQAFPQELQEKVGKELNTMPPKPEDKEYTRSRRQFLVTLASLPTVLFLSILHEHASPGRIEQFLVRCEASIAACWHLMRGSEYAVVEELLPTYLPLLASLALESSKYQVKAACLATQGYRLKGILALHHNDSKSRDAYFQQAVSYAEIAQNHGLFVAALISLAYHNADPKVAEHLYQKALLYEQTISPLQRSRLYVELSVTYAQENREDESRRYLDLAQQVYPNCPEEDTSFLYAEFSPSSMILEKGRMYLALSQQRSDKFYSQQAWDTFADITSKESSFVVSERIRYEIVNYQAETAFALHDRDLCCDRIELGASGARLLGSAKRRQEIIIIRNRALKRWPHDQQVKQLKSLALV